LLRLSPAKSHAVNRANFAMTNAVSAIVTFGRRLIAKA
jgi:hypothetical protein